MYICDCFCFLAIYMNRLHIEKCILNDDEYAQSIQNKFFIVILLKWSATSDIDQREGSFKDMFIPTSIFINFKDFTIIEFVVVSAITISSSQCIKSCESIILNSTRRNKRRSSLSIHTITQTNSNKKSAHNIVLH